MPRLTTRRLVRAGSDPLVHALLAAAVVAPLGRGPMLTAVAAGTLIDIDHPIAARSMRPAAMISLPARPRSHNLLATLGAGAIGAIAGGPVHGWAAFAGLASHLLRDASGGGAPTPLLWPWSPQQQVGRGWALAGIATLAGVSYVVSRAGASSAPSSAGADGAGAGTRPRTGSSRS
jgi:LexA-binding, inner membrane-associated putative hydrolase